MISVFFWILLTPANSTAAPLWICSIFWDPPLVSLRGSSRSLRWQKLDSFANWQSLSTLRDTFFERIPSERFFTSAYFSPPGFLCTFRSAFFSRKAFFPWTYPPPLLSLGFLFLLIWRLTKVRSRRIGIIFSLFFSFIEDFSRFLASCRRDPPCVGVFFGSVCSGTNIKHFLARAVFHVP